MAIRSSGHFPRYAARVAAVAVASAALAGFGAVSAGGALAATSPAVQNGAAPAVAPLSTSEDLKRGDSGPEVKALQERLAELGYWVGEQDGEFGGLTVQAVYAVQKAAGIARDGIVGPDTRAALEEGVRPSATSSSGDVIEVDLERQLLLVVSDGEVQQVMNTSTGSGETYESRGEQHVATTPEGEYRIFRGVDGWDKGPLGKLYRPKYFNGGIAIHGYTSVPPYPASHGCVRVSISAMDWLWENGKVENNTTVIVR